MSATTTSLIISLALCSIVILLFWAALYFVKRHEKKIEEKKAELASRTQLRQHRKLFQPIDASELRTKNPYAYTTLEKDQRYIPSYRPSLDGYEVKEIDECQEGEGTKSNRASHLQ